MLLKVYINAWIFEDDAALLICMREGAISCVFPFFSPLLFSFLFFSFPFLSLLCDIQAERKAVMKMLQFSSTMF